MTCLREFPVADRISKNFADELIVLTISNDKKREEMKKVVAKIGTTLPVLLDKDSKTFAAYRVRSLPTLHLIDQDQKVSRVWTGSIKVIEAELNENIKSLLEAHAPPKPEE